MNDHPFNTAVLPTAARQAVGTFYFTIHEEGYRVGLWEAFHKCLLAVKDGADVRDIMRIAEESKVYLDEHGEVVDDIRSWERDALVENYAQLINRAGLYRDDRNAIECISEEQDEIIAEIRRRRNDVEVFRAEAEGLVREWNDAEDELRREEATR